MSKRYDDARRGLEAASSALSRLREESGAEAPLLPTAGEAAAVAGLRAALDATRRALEDKARDLEASRARVKELEAERSALLDRAAGPRPDAERVQRAEAEAAKAKQSAAEEAAAMNGRLSIQQAEFVRLNALRRKAEAAVEQSELTRREVEDALRRDLRTVHASLDRSAAEAGAREARAQADIQSLTRRLEAALTRADQVLREQQTERDRWRGERNRLITALQRAGAVHASLRRELADLRVGLNLGVEEVARRLSMTEAELAKSRAGHDARVDNIAMLLSDARAEAARSKESQQKRYDALLRGLAAAETAAAKAKAGEEKVKVLLKAETDLSKIRALQGSHAEKIARRLAATLIARLRPGAAAAYERLRDLSSVVALTVEEAASLRSAASALAGLSDTVVVIERYLDEAPEGRPENLPPSIERALADWRSALERKGIRLIVSVAKDLGRAMFDTADMQLVLDQLLRRAFEILPGRCKLHITARRDAEKIEIVFEDDGPGIFPSEIEAAFDPGAGASGLALPLARRALRRWGGEATISKSEFGGRRVTLTLVAAA